MEEEEAMESLAWALLLKIGLWLEKGCPPSAPQTQPDQSYYAAGTACWLHNCSGSVGPNVLLHLAYVLSHQYWVDSSELQLLLLILKGYLSNWRASVPGREPFQFGVPAQPSCETALLAILDLWIWSSQPQRDPNVIASRVSLGLNLAPDLEYLEAQECLVHLALSPARL